MVTHNEVINYQSKTLPVDLLSRHLNASLASSGSSSPRKPVIMVKNSSKSISPEPIVKSD